MNRLSTCLAQIVPMALLVVATLLLIAPADVRGQVACEGDQCILGMPDAQGVTVAGRLDRPAQVRAYGFQVAPEAGTAHLYLGDLWYPIGMTLWRDPPSDAPNARCAPERGCLAESRESGPRVLQFLEPQVIVERVEPGSYTVFVAARGEAGFDPNRGYTLRIAVGPPSCGVQDDPGASYKLGLTIQPERPGPFDLITFTAALSPPYSDLFDFAWQIDGQAVPSAGVTMQRAASELGTGAEHRVRVKARGARAYPDPAQPHIPPTLSVECGFRVA